MLNPLCRPLALYCPASQRISVSSPTRHALAQIKVGTGQFRREQLGLWHQPVNRQRILGHLLALLVCNAHQSRM